MNYSKIITLIVTSTLASSLITYSVVTNSIVTGVIVKTDIGQQNECLAKENTHDENCTSSKVQVAPAVVEPKLAAKQINNKYQQASEPTALISFVDNAKVVEANSFNELMQQLDQDTEAHYRKLNTSFHELFQFDNAYQYQRLMKNGMPSPAELDYVYQNDYPAIFEKLRGYSRANPEQAIKSQKLAALALNRQIDELIALEQGLNNDFSFGQEISDWPAKMEGEYMGMVAKMIALHVKAKGLLPIAQMARVRFNELMISTGDHDRTLIEQNIVHLAVAGYKVGNNRSYQSYAQQYNLTESDYRLYVSIQLALR